MNERLQGGSGHRFLYNLSRISRKDKERCRKERKERKKKRNTIKYYGNDSIFVEKDGSKLKNRAILMDTHPFSSIS